MLSWLRSLIWRGIRSALWRHPSYVDLLALWDGELSQVNSRRTAAHLERCSLCQGERNRIEEDILRFKAVDQWVNAVAQPHFSEGRERLQRTIQAWGAFHSEASVRAESEAQAWERAQQSIAAEIDIYLGSRAAASLLHKLGGAGHDLQRILGVVEPVLQDFLGQVTASTVTAGISRIWYHHDNMAGSWTTPTSPQP